MNIDNFCAVVVGYFLTSLLIYFFRNRMGSKKFLGSENFSGFREFPGFREYPGFRLLVYSKELTID
eukprot:645054-Amorphochlora_amoeboformis.AAC.1